MVNGTQLIASIGAAAVERAGAVARQADVVAAMTLEVLKGTSRAFDSDVGRLRPHKGQVEVARRLRALLHSDTYPSEIAGECCCATMFAYNLGNIFDSQPLPMVLSLSDSPSLEDQCLPSPK